MFVPLWIQLILTVMAACQIAETLRHASLFESWRAWVESRGDFWAELIGCGFCFSHWSAATAVLLLVSNSYLDSVGYPVNPCGIILLWLAVIRGSNLLNDSTKAWSRSPTGDPIDLDDLEPKDEEPDDERTTE